MHTLSSGTLLRHGTYRIEKVLGQGSFGITYLATAKFTTQGNLGKMDVEAKVAIKEFFMSEVNGRSDDGSTVEGSSGSVFTNYRKKFKKEAENLSRLAHPNIVKVFDVFDENNTTYYVMEFLEGQNLDDYIKQCGFIEESEAVKIISEIGNALSYMHSKRMLHLDIKPKNIMRKPDGKDYLIDFGLSKQFTNDGEPESSTSIGLGTPGYAPIEQAGYKQDGTFPATLDVYALGATLFKMLTGKRPPEATYILNEGFPEKELTAKSVSYNTRSVLEKAMAPIKKQRFQTIKSFINGFAEERTIVDSTLKPQPTPKPNHEPNPKPQPVPTDIFDSFTSFAGQKIFDSNPVEPLTRPNVDKKEHEFPEYKGEKSEEERLAPKKEHKDRNGFITIWLWMGIIIGVAIVVDSVVRMFAPDASGTDVMEYSALSFSGSLVVLSDMLILRWNKIGFYIGIVPFIIVAVFGGVLIGMIEGLVVMSILWAILQIKKDGVSAWSQLQNGWDIKKCGNLYKIFTAIGVMLCILTWLAFR